MGPGLTMDYNISRCARHLWLAAFVLLLAHTPLTPSVEIGKYLLNTTTYSLRFSGSFECRQCAGACLGDLFMRVRIFERCDLLIR